MKIAIPLAQGTLAMHFGHCEQFALVDADEETKVVGHVEIVAAPAHQPGLLPSWLADRGVQVVIAGGMGRRAQQLFAQDGLEVVVGAPSETPERVVADYLAGRLVTGENVCDH